MGVRKMVYGVGVNDWPTPIVFSEAHFKFKAEKEAYIRSMADRYRSRIDEKVYLAMKNYTVKNYE